MLLNFIFPDYPDGDGGGNGNRNKTPKIKKETDKAVSDSDVNAVVRICREWWR